MNDNDLKMKTSKGKILIPLVIVLLTVYVGKQQIFQNYIVGINGWGLGFFSLFFYAIFEAIERVSGDKSGKFRTFKYFSGFMVFISFLMVVFDWETKNLDLIFWLLLFSFIGIISFTIINTDMREFAGLDGLNLQIKDTEAELKEVRRQIANANGAQIDFENDNFDDDFDPDEMANIQWINDIRFPLDSDGGAVEFDYKSKDGFVGHWELSEWYATDIMIEGKLARNGEPRTFRKEKISNWQPK